MGCTAIEQPGVVCEDCFFAGEYVQGEISHMEGHAAEEASPSMAGLAKEI